MNDPRLIQETYAPYGLTPAEMAAGSINAVVHHGELAGLRTLLLGHKVQKIADDHLQLDDGTILKIVPNQGGCICGAGDYELKDLNAVDNIITAVDEDIVLLNDDEWEPDRAYRVFVVAEDKHLQLFSIEGNDGNGWYGTGYDILVRYPE